MMLSRDQGYKLPQRGNPAWQRGREACIQKRKHLACTKPVMSFPVIVWVKRRPTVHHLYGCMQHTYTHTHTHSTHSAQPHLYMRTQRISSASDFAIRVT